MFLKTSISVDASTIALLTCTYFSYLIILITYRLYFSPVSRFPGPKLAAATYWYEFYYDIILRGRYLWKIKELHEIYGPIIRINPHELHVLDPAFYDTLYGTKAGVKRNRDVWHTNGLAMSGSVLDSPSHDLHRKRRAALSPFFSMASSRKLHPLVEERISILKERLLRRKDTGQEVNILLVFAAFTNDIIEEYCFGNSHHRLEAPDFDPTFHTVSFGTANMVCLLKQFPVLGILINSIPKQLGQYMGKGIKDIIDVQNTSREQVENVKATHGKHDTETKTKTIFHTLLDSDLPASKKATERLVFEGMTLVGAGSHTVAWTLTVGTYHILSNPSILKKLKNELRNNAQQNNGQITRSVPELEKLPYLTAVIKECLRLSYGVTFRMARISPDLPMKYQDWVIPAGVSVSMSGYHMHHDESIYPDSHAFKPERWLGCDIEKLDKQMVAFSGGSRICLGINLAWAELYLAMSALFYTFGGEAYSLEGDEGVLELFETDESDVQVIGDKFFGLVKEGSKGVRVRVSS